MVWLPDNARRFFDYMQEHDVLAGYRTWPVVERALFSITRRLEREGLNDLLRLIAQEQLPWLETDFFNYFPDMLTHARNWFSVERQSS